MRYAAQDAKAIAEVLGDGARGQFDQVKSRVLLDAVATHNEILKALKGIVAEARPGDTVVFYFAGHGDGVDPILLPADVVTNNRATLRETGFDAATLSSMQSQIAA